MTAYKKTLQSLYDLQMFGMKVGLQNIWALAEYLGHPEFRFPSIHVAGTNGKGSTSSMIAAILTASGYKTGLYTSPHLVHFAERIRIDGKCISEDEIVEYTTTLMPLIRKHQATFFEATTAMAFQYFADHHVDIAVIETGLGGRLDATNIISPVVSIITGIGFDHTEYLGTTISAIAKEKGGIIKPFTPCIMGRMNAEALTQLAEIAHSQDAEVFLSDVLSSVEIKQPSIAGSVIDAHVCNKYYKEIFLSLPGEHQTRNLQLALLAIDTLRLKYGFLRITDRTLALGLSDVQRIAGLHGRSELIRSAPIIITDVAHNPDGMRTFVETIRSLIVGKGIVVFGVMNDKAYNEMISSLQAIARKVIAVQPQTTRALQSSALVEKLQESGISSIDGGKLQTGLGIALRELRANEALLITGSHYVVGEAMATLDNVD